MMDVDFYAEVDPLNRTLRLFAKEMQQELPALVDQAGRTLSRTLAEETMPFGSFSTARQKNQATALADVAKVYMTPTQMYERMKAGRLVAGSRGTPEGVAKAFSKALVSGNLARAQRILEHSGMDGRLRLQKARIERFDRGEEQLRRRSGSTGRVSGKVPTVILSDTKGFATWKNRLKNREVGRAKGAWADCSRKLGSTRGFPQWLVKAGDGEGQVDRRTSFGEPYVVLTARPSYMSRLLSESRAARAAHVAAGKMHKMVTIVLEKRAQKLLGGEA